MESNENLRFIQEEYSDSWGWLAFGGVMFVILGIIAYLYPVTSTVGITFYIAALLVISGAVQFIQSLFMWSKPHNFARLLSSVVALVAGILIFRYPGGGIEAVALALSFYFFVSAALKWWLAMQLPFYRGWGIFSSILTFFLGVYIIAGLPFTALWVPGLLLGLDLVFSGINMIAFAIAFHKPAARLTHAH
ncbi:MAG: HdeD family acid-resistance protein [Bdellovibrionales bacterium]